MNNDNQTKLNDDSAETSILSDCQNDTGESDEHLPRVQIELDKLNYANESINNLELELVDSKKEFVRTMQEGEEELAQLERKLGACVAKSLPYFEARIELHDAKDKYLKAKIRFETAQELYVAAKNMQMYAEETLEKEVVTHLESEDVKLLQLAKVKVNETEVAKQTSDLELVTALRSYEEKLEKTCLVERDLKKSIEKSAKYYELKASQLKELKFLVTKIEGLKSCLKEAKLAYQQSLKNLETISTEIHTQRQTMKCRANGSDSNNNCTSPSSSTLSSTSSSSISLQKLSTTSEVFSQPLSDIELLQDEPDPTIECYENASLKTLEHQSSTSVASEEDYDVYFLNNKTKPSEQQNSNNSNSNSNTIQTRSGDSSTSSTGTTSLLFSFGRNNSFNSSKSNSFLITEEDIENLKFAEKLKKYKSELDNNNNSNNSIKNAALKNDAIHDNEQKVTQISANTSQQQQQQQQPLNAEKLLESEINTTLIKNNNVINTRPQFRVPAFFSNINRK